MSTYAPNDAITLVSSFVHGVPVSAVSAQCCDIVNSMMWCFYPWSWSIASLTPIACVDGTQDYTPTDGNILRPLKLRLVRTDVSPNEFRELAFLANLSPELSRKGGIDSIQACGYFASGPFIRLVMAMSIGSGQTVQIQGEYQHTPTKITSGNLATPFTFSDHYFNVFVEGLKWKLYQLADDARAGTASYAKNGTMMRQYSGQLGIFRDAMLEMARTEDLQAGDEFMFPESGMGERTGMTWPGIYGL